MIERKKPLFLRRDWHKRTRFMRKKKMKWRKAKGMDNKTRLAFKGYPQKVKIGWGKKAEEKGKINGMIPIRVENLGQLSNVGKGYAVIIGSVGRKNKEAMIKKAEEMKLTMLNKYRRKNAAS